MVQSIRPDEARSLLAENTLDVVDARDSTECSSGHLPGARHVPLSRLRSGTRAWAKAGLPLVKD